jgi:hypothetical protein
MKLQRKQNTAAAAALQPGVVPTVIILDPTGESARPPHDLTANHREWSGPANRPAAPESSPLRALLKSRLPRHTASATLMRRIESAIQRDEI